MEERTDIIKKNSPLSNLQYKLLFSFPLTLTNNETAKKKKKHCRGAWRQHPGQESLL